MLVNQILGHIITYDKGVFRDRNIDDLLSGYAINIAIPENTFKLPTQL